MFGNIALAAAGILIAAAGAATTFAAGMATIPDQKMGNRGCVSAIVGIGLIVVAVIRAF